MSDVTFVLIGNKADLIEDRDVSYDEASELGSKFTNYLAICASDLYRDC